MLLAVGRHIMDNIESNPESMSKLDVDSRMMDSPYFGGQVPNAASSL